MSDIRLSDPLRPLVGTSAAALHKHLDLRTVGDLLRHYPRRYVRLGELTTIRDLPLGEDVSLVAEVVSTATAQMKTRRGTMLHVVVTDGTDRLKMTFFNARRIARAFQVGQRMLFSGRVDEFRGEIRLNHPRWRAIGGEQDAAAAAVARPVPVYPLAGSLAGDTVAKSVGVVLDQLAEQAKARAADSRTRCPPSSVDGSGWSSIDEAFEIDPSSAGGGARLCRPATVLLRGGVRPTGGAGATAGARPGGRGDTPAEASGRPAGGVRPGAALRADHGPAGGG